MLRYIKTVIPKYWHPYLNKKRWDLMIMYADYIDHKNVNDEKFPVPPSRLRFRVHGSVDQKAFLTNGLAIFRDILGLLQYAKREISEFESVLDFGCGCGRVLRQFHEKGPRIKLYGADIDQEAIVWCKTNLPFAQFTTNASHPPMKYCDKNFDLIFAISVFTHLDEEMQIQWLKEIYRVSRPGAMIIISIIGASAYKQELSVDNIQKLEQDGILFVEVGGLGKNKVDDLPDFYQLTYHTEEYIRRICEEHFEVLAYLPQAIGQIQDAVILTRR